jgi:hypothetical protein
LIESVFCFEEVIWGSDLGIFCASCCFAEDRVRWRPWWCRLDGGEKAMAEKHFGLLGGGAVTVLIAGVGALIYTSKPRPPVETGGIKDAKPPIHAETRRDHIKPRAADGKGGTTVGQDKEEARQTPQPPPSQVREVEKTQGVAGTPSVRLRYEVVLRSRSIHRVSAQGQIQEDTITLEQLAAMGRIAKKEDRDLVLRIQGDAKAQWVKEIKRSLTKEQIPFSITNEF